MINLLPPEHAASIRYGRQNTVLRKWLIGMAVAIVGLVMIVAGGWFYINRQSASLQKGINTTNQLLKTQNLSKVQADAKEISGDIRVINQVLRGEIRFSDLIQAIGQVIPKGAILSGLSISQVNGALDLSVNATNYATAAQVAANLSDPKNGIFSKVDVVNVACNPSGASTPGTPNGYTCSLSLKALFGPDTKNKFLSVPKEDHS
jgi:Tfp pilus assembly protein PilN